MPRVLVVDDEPNILFVLNTALQEVGHQVTTATNGREALAAMQAAAEVPDVVLLDLLMPELGGREVVAAMRQDPRLAAVPVILVTGSGADGVSFPPRHTYQALINKPFDLIALLDLVEGTAEANGTMPSAAGSGGP